MFIGFAWICMSPQPVMIKIWYVWWSGGQEMSGVRPVFRSSRGLSLANQAELPGPGNAWDDQWLHLTHVQKLRSSAYFDIFPLFVTFFHIGERINIQIIGFKFNIGKIGMANTWHRMERTQGVEVESSHVIRALRAALQGHFEDGLTGHSRRGHPVTFAYWACEILRALLQILSLL